MPLGEVLEPLWHVLRVSGGVLERDVASLNRRDPSRRSPRAPCHSALQGTKRAKGASWSDQMPKAQAGNPDWVDWVQELVDDAEAIGSKASQTYKKVCPHPVNLFSSRWAKQTPERRPLTRSGAVRSLSSTPKMRSASAESDPRSLRT